MFKKCFAGFTLSILFTAGTPPMTGTGTLMVTLTDINDNFPQFAQDYRPVVYENQPAGQLVVEISAKDADTARHGPPFEFWLPCGGGCPCKTNPTCGKFSFEFKQGWSLFFFVSVCPSCATGGMYESDRWEEVLICKILLKSCLCSSDTVHSSEVNLPKISLVDDVPHLSIFSGIYHFFPPSLIFLRFISLSISVVG